MNAIANFKRNHSRFLEDKPNATIADLIRHLEKALDQCLNRGDDTIDEDVPAELSFELAEWSDTEGESFECYYDSIEDLLNDAQEIADDLGDDAKLSECMPICERLELDRKKETVSGHFGFLFEDRPETTLGDVLDHQCLLVKQCTEHSKEPIEDPPQVSEPLASEISPDDFDDDGDENHVWVYGDYLPVLKMYLKSLKTLIDAVGQEANLAEICGYCEEIEEKHWYPPIAKRQKQDRKMIKARMARLIGKH